MIENFIEIKLYHPDDFLKVKETLTRIGIPSKIGNTLFQSCHILHKREKYYIVHFKELFALDGKPTNFSDEDRSRRNTIVDLLEGWGLLEIVNRVDFEKEEKLPMNKLKVISFKEKADWSLESKYQIGKKRV